MNAPKHEWKGEPTATQINVDYARRATHNKSVPTASLINPPCPDANKYILID